MIPRVQRMLPRSVPRSRVPVIESNLHRVARTGQGVPRFASTFGIANAGVIQILNIIAPGDPFVIEAVSMGMDVEQTGLGVYVSIAMGPFDPTPATALANARDVFTFNPSKEMVRYDVGYLYEMVGGAVTFRLLNAGTVTCRLPFVLHWHRVEARETLTDPMGSGIPRAR